MPPKAKKARIEAAAEPVRDLEGENRALRALLGLMTAPARRIPAGALEQRPTRVPETLHVPLQHNARNPAESEASNYTTVMERLPDNLATLPTQQRIEFQFTSPTMVTPATMTMDIDISQELRRAQNIPEIMEIRITQVADGVTPEWYAHALVGTAYHWAMTKASYQPRPDQDRGRVILKSSDLRQKLISTPTTPIQRLAAGVVQTIEAVMQSAEEFDVNRECLALVQIMLSPRGGRGANAPRPILTKIDHYFRNKTLLDPDWVQPPFMEWCMILAVMMSTVRHTNELTGDVHILLNLNRPGFGEHVCADVMKRAGLNHSSAIDTIHLTFAQMWQNYRDEIRRLEVVMREKDPDLPAPHQWTEQHLGPIADTLRICIHVIAFEAGTVEINRFGETFTWEHLYILRGDGHYFAVTKPHILFANNRKSGRHHSNVNSQKFCDRCKGTCVNDGARHRLKCMPRPLEEKTVDALYHRRIQGQYRSPFDEYTKTWRAGKLGWCHTCHTSIGLIKPPTSDELENLDVGLEFYRDMVWEMKRARDQEGYEWCRSRGHDLEAMYYKICSNCKAPVPHPYHYSKRYKYINEHVCSCERPTLKIGEETKYWLWDIECVQKPINGVNELPAILVCACNMANPDLRLEFSGYDCIDRFMDTILGKAFKGTTWIAHNGASFDVQYICRWLHRHGLNYEHTTSPGSMHSLQEVKHQHLRFIDSVKFIPMALAGFGKTFGLDVAKGDFPLRFAIEQHLDYMGPMPPIDAPDDWYNLAMRGRAGSPEESQQEVDKFRQWHAEESQKFWSPQNPDRPKWMFWEQLKKYCWLDVEVLRRGCQLYRNEFLAPQEHIDGWTCMPVDPFQYMTLPQTLQALFLNGLPNGEQIAAVPRIPKIKQRQSRKALQWMLSYQMKLREELQDPELQIRHVYNSPQGREYYVGLPDDTYQALDGYLRAGGKEYFF